MRSNKDFRLQLDFISLVLFVLFRYFFKKEFAQSFWRTLFFFGGLIVSKKIKIKTENEMAG